jgi:DUF971 family protein
MLPTLRKADLNEERTALVLDWADGALSVYPLTFLRAQCPCASCRTLRDQAGSAAKDPFRVIPTNLLQPNSEMAGVEPVGRYGMRIIWADGHNTGIYTFEYLRELAETPEVRKASGEAMG